MTTKDSFSKIQIRPNSLLFSNAGGPCDKIESESWGHLESIKICYLSPTFINSTDYLNASYRDETVEAIDALRNRKIDYLPRNIGEFFPNIVALDAAHCSIKEITKENFKGLSKLRLLRLASNKIEKIDDDAFEYIPAVEQIWLSE